MSLKKVYQKYKVRMKFVKNNSYHILMNLSRVKYRFQEEKIEKATNECYNCLVYFRNRFLTQSEYLNSRRKFYDTTQNF